MFKIQNKEDQKWRSLRKTQKENRLPRKRERTKKLKRSISIPSVDAGLMPLWDPEPFISSVIRL
jgi:hypothetical protein